MKEEERKKLLEKIKKEQEIIKKYLESKGKEYKPLEKKSFKK